MRHLKITYVCFALSVLCLLLISCKDDEDPYPAGKELVNYEMTLFRVEYGAPKPNPLPKDCIVYSEELGNCEVCDNNLSISFYYEGNLYPIGGLPIPEMRDWTMNKSSVQVLLSGKFYPCEDDEVRPDSGSKKDDYSASFYVSSITLK
ncbi:hypothetical protein [Bacteroides sp.]|uniref:hypothetical protein n=1 Tax=Bacteroides sp. TaxID=29523 RepID=UPI003A941D63